MREGVYKTLGSFQYLVESVTNLLSTCNFKNCVEKTKKTEDLITDCICEPAYLNVG